MSFKYISNKLEINNVLIKDYKNALINNTICEKKKKMKHTSKLYEVIYYACYTYIIIYIVDLFCSHRN